MEYKNYKIEEFLNKTSSTESMPGGGTVSALVAASAVSLALKVCNLSLGKEKYKEHEQLIKDSIQGLEEHRERFLSFMDEDAEKFKVMEEVFKMPKETDDEKEKRKIALENACKVCCDVPLKIITSTADVTNYMTKLVGKTNESAMSDLVLGLMFSLTAMRGAWENILINMKYISDDKFKDSLLVVKKQIGDIILSLEKIAK